MTTVFAGDSPNGVWSLYLVDDAGNADVSFTDWTIVLTVSSASSPSTTVLTPNPTTAYRTSPNSSVVLTATVTGGATGNVTFKDAGTNVTCSEGANPRPVSSSVAVCTTAFSTEGIHVLSAVYSGDGTFVTSTGTANVYIQNHATNTVGHTYCNAGAITNNGRSDLAFSNTSPYPSVIFVGDGQNPDLTNSVNTVSVTLKNFSATGMTTQHMLLVAPDGAHAYDFWSNVGISASAGDYTIQDGSGQIPNSTVSPGTYGPTADGTPPDTFTSVPSPAPQIPGSFSYATPEGDPNSKTFQTAFVGAGAHGAWSLFLYNASGSAITAGASGGWCVNISPATGFGTTVTETSSANPFAVQGASVSFTATISSAGHPTPNQGTVTFTENGSPLTGAPNSGVANVSGGAATIATTGLPEGDHTITASYHDSTGTYNDNFGTFTIRIDKATATPTLSGSTWSYCNAGPITIPVGSLFVNDIGPGSPNPSNIFVTNLPGTISSMTVKMKNFSVFRPTDLESLLVGPNGASAPTNTQTFDFFSKAGGINPYGPADTTFTDSSAAVPSNSPPGASSGPASYGPTSYTASPFYILPATPQHATTAGQFTFNTGALTGTSGGVYSKTDPNGTWSVYFNQLTHSTGSGASGGWCVNFIENPVTGTGTTSHTGPAPSNHMKQGGTGSIAFSLLNNGDSNSKGSTGDPDGSHGLVVVGTLPSGLTFGTVPTGSPWACTVTGGNQLSCKSSNAIAAGSSYPLLTLPVNVSPTAPATASVSGFTFSGAGMTAGTFSTDTITIDPAPILAVTKAHTGTFTQGSTADWKIQVSNNSATAAGATDGSTVTVSDTLPTGYTLNTFSGTGWSCTGNNVVTCLSTSVVAGNGGTFPLLTLTVNIPVDSATTVSNTAKVFGGGDITHTSIGNAASGSDNGVPVVQVPKTISINGSATQSTAVGTAFGSLAVTVKDAGGVVIPSYSSVVFTAVAGGSGQSGTFDNATNTKSLTTAAVTGIADPGVFTANGFAGAYTVDVAAGPATHATFNLTNTDTAAAVTNVTSTTVDGAYGVGATVTITVGFNKNVVVTGTPQLALNSGGTASYSSGSATSTLSFTYTVAAGQNSADLDYTSTAALSLNGGTIKNTSTLNANLTLPAPGAAGSLGANKNIVIDTTAPTVTNVTSTTVDGTYGTGASIAITVAFSKAVTVTGTPLLGLNSSGSASYSTGSGTNTLTFAYTVGAGQSSPDLDYSSTTALTLNGGTIKDSATNNATLTLPAPGAAGSLGANKNIVIDTTAPTVTNVTSTTVDGTYGAGASIAITVAFSKAVTVTGTPLLGLNSGGSASYSTGSGTNTLTFTYTVLAGQSSSDLDYSSATALTLNSGTIKDSANNSATLTLPAPGGAGSLGANKNIVIDTAGAAVTNVTSTTTNGTYGVGSTITVTVTFNKAVNVAGGTPSLALNSGGTAAYSSGSATSTLSFTYTVAAGQNSSDLDYTSTSALALNGATIKDSASNNATLTLPAPGASGSLGFNKNIVIDTTAPTVTNVTSTNVDGTYGVGANIAVTVTFNEAVTVTGTPQLALNSGGTATYSTGSGTNTLTFAYPVLAGQNSADLDYTSTLALTLNGGTIKDAGSNNATLTLSAPGAAGSLGANKNIVIDTTSASVTNVSSTTADGTYGVGANIAITVTFSKAVIVTGTPTLALNSGGTGSYTSGSGTSTLTFTYTVGAGQNSADLDYTSTSALALSGGTIKDSAANNANLTLPAPGAAGSLGANKNIVISTTPPAGPTVVSYNVLFGIDSYNVTGSLRTRLPWQITGVQVVFSAPITSGDINSLTGLSTTGFSGLGTNTLTWTITPVVLGNFPTTLVATGADALKDGSGNALNNGVSVQQGLKVLWGDVNDDGVVNSTDFAQVNQGRSLLYNIFFDVNGDGVVDNTDVTLARSKIGTSLP